MATIESYSYTEAHDSCTGTVGKDGSTQRILILKPFSDLNAFLKVLASNWSKTAGNVWTYFPGHQHPNFPGMYCAEASWKPEGESSWDTSAKKSNWAAVRITATYRPPMFDPTKTDPRDIYEEDLDFSVEELTLPSKSFKKTGSSSEDDKIQNVIRKLIPVCSYTLTLIDVPNLPGPNGDTSLIWSLQGKINSAVFKGAALKTALFLGATTSRTMTSQGTRGWKIALKHMVRPAGLEWDKVFHAKDGKFVQVDPVAGGGDPLYTTGDLNQLLPQ